MTGIENITGRIQSDAQAEIDKINAKAKAQADEILAGYEAKAQKQKDALLEKGQKNAEEYGKRLVSAAEMEAKKSLLAAKQEMLDRAFDLALEKLLKLPEQAYVDLLAALVAQASVTGEETLLFNEKDLAGCGAKVAEKANALLKKQGKEGKLTPSKQTRKIQGGLLISDGAVEVNCALETLVRLLRSEVTGEVSKVLFP